MSSRPWLRSACLAAWMTLALLTAVCLRNLGAWMYRPEGNDLSVYLAAARALVTGGNPYAVPLPQGFSLYPLTIAALLVPLTWLPIAVAQFGWFALNVAALLGALGTLDRLWVPEAGARDVRRYVPFVVRLAAVAVVFFFPLRRHLKLGQVDLIVLFFCCRFLRADLGGRGLAAGMWLGGAIAVKLAPVILVVPLLLKRNGRTLILTAAFVVLWAVVLPALASSQVLALYRDSWWPGLAMEVAAPVTLRRHTLAGTLAAWWPALADHPAFRYAAAGLVLLPLAWVSRRVGEWRQGRMLGFALCLVAIPLISPLSGGHRRVVALGGLWIWISAAGRWPLRWPVATGAAVFLLANWHGVAGRSPGLGVGALLVLYLLLLVETTRATSATAPAPGAVAESQSGRV